jgi:hypothetical protein
MGLEPTTFCMASSPSGRNNIEYKRTADFLAVLAKTLAESANDSCSTAKRPCFQGLSE